MWFSQNLPLSPVWISVHALEGAYIGHIYHPWGLNVFSVLGLWQCRLRGVAVSVADPGCEERGGRTGFWGLAPKIFWVHLSQFRGLFKEFDKNRGCCHWVSLILPIYVLTVALRWAWRTFYVSAHPPPPAYGPVSCWQASITSIFKLFLLRYFKAK